MAQGSDQMNSRRFALNLQNVNMNPAERVRVHESLYQLVQGMLPGTAPHQNMAGNIPPGPGFFNFRSTAIDSDGMIDQSSVPLHTHSAGDFPLPSSGHGHSHGRFHPYGHHGHNQSHSRVSLNGPDSRGSSPDSFIETSSPSNSFVINIGGDNALHQALGPEGPEQHGHSHSSIPDENQNTTGSHGNGHNGQSPAGINLRNVYKMMEGSIPFIILLFAKLLYNHRLGILVLVGLYGTYHHANKTIKRQIAQRETQRWHAVLNLLWIIVFLSANILFIYEGFKDQQLYKSLLLQPPATGRMDVWTLFWVTGITDFVLKFAAIILKAVVALLPRSSLPHKKRGKYYMLIEHLSQFYRCIVPIVPWVAFLMDDQEGGQWFAIVLLIIYTLSKGQHLRYKISVLRAAFSKFQVDVSYGSCPSGDDLSTCDNCCPICQDKFNEPVKLSCKHIFCEDCVSMWFDRERTCPMCRANIVDNPVWRDGTTSGNMQLY